MAGAAPFSEPISARFSAPYSARLIAAGDEIRLGAAPQPTLALRVPWLRDHIEADAAAHRFTRWGTSTVCENSTSSPVIPGSLFKYLHELARIDARWPIGNAGLLHVYGYLLAATDTDHGPKRVRWLRPQLARALGLNDEHFLPWSDPHTTLLQRVLETATPLLRDPLDAEHVWFWADEFASLDSGSIPRSSAMPVMRTVVVLRAGSTDGALVYGEVSVCDDALARGKADESAPRLVTMFPVSNIDHRWVESFLASPPRLRYNATRVGMPPRAALSRRRVFRQP